MWVVNTRLCIIHSSLRKFFTQKIVEKDKQDILRHEHKTHSLQKTIVIALEEGEPNFSKVVSVGEHFKSRWQWPPGQPVVITICVCFATVICPFSWIRQSYHSYSLGCILAHYKSYGRERERERRLICYRNKMRTKLWYHIIHILIGTELEKRQISTFFCQHFIPKIICNIQ